MLYPHYFLFLQFYLYCQRLLILVLGTEYQDAKYLLPLLVLPMMQIITNVTFVGVNFYKKTKLFSCNIYFFVSNILKFKFNTNVWSEAQL